MSRFDNRSKEQFKKDVYFGTMIEKLFMDLFIDSCRKKQDVEILHYYDHGVANDGSFIEEGVNTSGADYMLENFKYRDDWYDKLPLEVKWVPTYGKLTLKLGDLKAYQREKAAILFLYTTKKLDLKKPANHNLEKHKMKILANCKYINWGIMMPRTVDFILNTCQDDIKPIPYMGNKPGIIIPQSQFGSFFREETLL